jgi:hypothetical protein
MERRKFQVKGAEFRNFDATMRKLIAVPHSEIKAQLDVEKAAKGAKKLARKK